MSKSSEDICLFWFRRDLRLHDNRGLFKALSEEGNVQPMFIFDRNILEKLEDKNDRRVAFIHAQLESIDAELRRNGSSLWVFHGDPIEVHKDLLQRHSIAALYANNDYEPYARERDNAVSDLYASHNIVFRAFKDHVIHEKDEVLKDDGSPYIVYTPYSKRWKEILTDTDLDNQPSEAHLDRMRRSTARALPSLEDIGFEPHPADWPDPEIDLDVIRNYHKTRDTPGINGVSKVSVHLRFGTVSTRAMMRIGREHNQKWFNELIWREFYQSILWHFPRVVNESFRKEYDHIEWRNNEEEFAAWCEGRTGFPIVDAGIRELNETGYMHNRVRMITASFLTKDLLIDWRWGEAYFARKLLDFDLASNNGGWQWAAGTGVDAAPYFRIFNPDAQTERFDPDRSYIKRWVPEYQDQGYPDPIVDHKLARERTLKAYKVGLNP